MNDSKVTNEHSVNELEVKKTENQKIHVKIYSPYNIYFDDEAYSISAVNGTGPFDVLPMHHNFITLLNPCEIIVNHDNRQIKIRIARGVMHVKADKVVVFLDV